MWKSPTHVSVFLALRAVGSLDELAKRVRTRLDLGVPAIGRDEADKGEPCYRWHLLGHSVTMAALRPREVTDYDGNVLGHPFPGCDTAINLAIPRYPHSSFSERQALRIIAFFAQSIAQAIDAEARFERYGMGGAPEDIVVYPPFDDSEYGWSSKEEVQAAYTGPSEGISAHEYFTKGTEQVDLANVQRSLADRAHEFATARYTVEELKKLLHDNPASTYLRKPLLSALIAAKDYSAAIEEYRTAFKQNPRGRFFYLGLGPMLAAWQWHTTQLRPYREAVAAKPTGDNHHTLGNVLFNLAYYEEAKQEYLMALPLSPDKDDVSLHLGMAYEALHEWDAALTEFRRVSKTSPVYSEAMKRQTRIMGSGHLSE